MLGSLLFFALPGCFLKPAALTPEEQSAKIEAFIADGGYIASQQHSIKSIREIWLHEKVLLDMTLSAPGEPGRFPVIVYLPGLGEDANAGALWRQAWAKSGYAVVTVQPVELAAALKDLESVQNGPDAGKAEEKDELKRMQALRYSDLRYIGREYFSAAGLKKRIGHAAWALTELTRRAQAKSSLFASLDLSRVIIAGYDIGAQTVAALVGESVNMPVPDLGGLHPMAAIILSPSVDLASGDIDSRFKDMRLPMLIVTGTADDDPYGIGVADVRAAMWQYVPAGDKYLLLLEEAKHGLFAGSGLQQAQGELEQDGFGGPGAGMPGFAAEFGGGMGSGGPPGGGGMGGPPPMGRAKSARQDFKQLAMIRSVTTAFLDAVVKSDASAKKWLNADGTALWLGRSATLKNK